MKKKCTKCGELKELSEYYLDVHCRYFSECRACNRKRNKQRYDKNPEKVKEIVKAHNEKVGTDVVKGYLKKSREKLPEGFLNWEAKINKEARGILTPPEGFQISRRIPARFFFETSLQTLVNVSDNLFIIPRYSKNKIDWDFINSNQILKDICEKLKN
jgi:hypothetical protein